MKEYRGINVINYRLKSNVEGRDWRRNILGYAKQKKLIYNFNLFKLRVGIIHKNIQNTIWSMF
jgi:hypothetical protein